MTPFSWQSLPRPFLAQAPMEDVTDVVFREIIASCAPPDIFFTEFTNVDGMLSVGRHAVMHRLRLSPYLLSSTSLLSSSSLSSLSSPLPPPQRPIVAQLWGTDSNKFYEATNIVVAMGFDGVDINMGCPDKTVMKKGACAGLIGNFEQSARIISSVQHAAGGLPVSVKTRLGIKTVQTEEWIGFLLTQNLDAITIHARTVAELSDVPARWDEIGKAVKLRNKLSSPTCIIGNGDVESKTEALEKCTQYGCDGIMIGRGIFHNLYVFGGEKEFKAFSKEEKIAHLIRHISLFDKTWGSTKNFASMKKFYKMYITGFDGASDLRAQLMKFTTVQDTLEFLATLR